MDHGKVKCAVCNGPTTNFNISTESKGRCEVNWLQIGGGPRIGISGYRNIPEQILDITNWLDGKNRLNPAEVILFPSLVEGREFTSAMGAGFLDMQSIFMKRKLSISRYTVLGSVEFPNRYYLIYTKRVSGDQFLFLLDFIEAQQAGKKLDHETLELGSRINSSIIRVYSSKLGFDFVSHSTELRKASLRGSNKLWSTFAECLALQKCISSANIGAAADFLDEKVDSVFHMIDWEMIEWFSEVLNLLGGYVHAFTLIRSMSGKGELEHLLQHIFEEQHQRLKKRLRRHPDLLKALDCVIQNAKGVDSSTDYETYVQEVEKVLTSAAMILSPVYVQLDETAEYSLASREYSRQIEFGLKGSTVRFGPTGDYIRKGEEIFQRANIYPEVRIYVAKAVSGVLESLFLKNHDYGAYLKFTRLSREEAILYEIALPEVRRKNRGSPIDFLDAAQGLLVTHTFARMLDEHDEAEKAYQSACSYVERHDIKPLKTQIYWTQFLRTHDYRYLRNVYDLHISLDPKSIRGFEGTNLFVGQVAAAILGESDPNVALDKGEKFLGGDIAPDSLMGIVLDQFGLEYCLYLSRLLRALFVCVEKLDGLGIEGLRVAAQVMDAEISPLSYLRTIVLKTQILCGTILSDSATVTKSVSKLSVFALPASPIWSFVQAAVNWTETPQERRSLRFYQLLESDLDHQDPWSRILADFMRREIRKELRPEDILDYDAVVFVEGKIDARVYPILSKTVGNKVRPLFIDVGGWTNMAYFANAKVAVSVAKPIMVLFDGDTNALRNRKIKARLVRELRVPANRILTLSKGSLENYLLVPDAIKRAFPEITASEDELRLNIRKMERKRNKKGLLDSILKEYAHAKYDETSAARIATGIRKEEVDPKLISILLKLIP